MFAQMKSRHRQYEHEPCPCGGSCSCHKPHEDNIMVAIIIFIAVWFGLGIGAAYFVSHLKPPSPQVRHIQVNGQDCIVQYVEDSCTSTGACSGHDIAVCPKDK